MDVNEKEVMENQTAEAMTATPLDTLMLRYSELDQIIREIGFEGVIQMGARGTMPRYSIRRGDGANPQEISLFLRETNVAGSGMFAMITRVPFKEHSVEEI